MCVYMCGCVGVWVCLRVRACVRACARLREQACATFSAWLYTFEPHSVVNVLSTGHCAQPLFWTNPWYCHETLANIKHVYTMYQQNKLTGFLWTINVLRQRGVQQTGSTSQTGCRSLPDPCSKECWGVNLSGRNNKSDDKARYRFGNAQCTKAMLTNASVHLVTLLQLSYLLPSSLHTGFETLSCYRSYLLI